MTVAELMKLLSAMPQDKQVAIGGVKPIEGNSAYCEFNAVEVTSDGAFVSLEWY